MPERERAERGGGGRARLRVGGLYGPENKRRHTHVAGHHPGESTEVENAMLRYCVGYMTGIAKETCCACKRPSVQERGYFGDGGWGTLRRGVACAVRRTKRDRKMEMEKQSVYMTEVGEHGKPLKWESGQIMNRRERYVEEAA